MIKTLEHVTFEQGQRCLEITESQSPELSQFFDQFRRSDGVGQPRTYVYGRFGEFAPTTLRYIKVLSDLKTLFGDLTHMNLIEIGVGYGGQCKITSDVFDFSSYQLVDLEPVLKLARKFLNQFDVKGAFFLTPDKLQKEVHYDLVISNYAFSELARRIQDFYLDQIINTASRGYMILNRLKCGPGVYTPENLCQKIKKSRLIPETPQTGHSNCILIWGEKELR